MLLSIIVPVYNVEKYIERCLMSLVNQDLISNEYEIIVVDDGSPDRSAVIVESLQKKYDNIILLHKSNGGLSSARNYGMDFAKGKYMMFVDSDDYIEPNVLGMLISTCLKYDLDYLGYGLTSITNGMLNPKPRWEKHPDPYKLMSMSNYISNYTVIISACGHIARREIYENNKIRFLEGIIHEDYEFMFRFYKYVNRMMFTDIAVYNYDIKESDTITTIRTEAQNRRSVESWIAMLVSLNNILKDFNHNDPDYIRTANLLLNNYRYVALTNLLLKRLPIKDKFVYFNQLKAAKALKIGRSNLSPIRKFRSFIYRIPGMFRLLTILTSFRAK